ncbi:hypothetical protein [Owenweeksia hongkongensis]|uniref:hypothetical protein n=1 Tax=Owenweeksia hongkongensis TaxID=253245 RepID=UPI003A8DAB0D
MLIQDFYEHISTNTVAENHYEVTVHLNPNSAVYAGHFPDQPIAPGVILTQMVKEISNEILGKSWILREASQIKFLAMVNPNKTSQLTLDLVLQPEENSCKIKCVAKDAEISYFKLIGTLS